jgi:hypothetical protein
MGYGPQGKEFFVSWGSGTSRVKWPSLSVIITSCPIHLRLLSNGPVQVDKIISGEDSFQNNDASQRMKKV